MALDNIVAVVVFQVLAVDMAVAVDIVCAVAVVASLAAVDLDHCTTWILLSLSTCRHINKDVLYNTTSNTQIVTSHEKEGVFLLHKLHKAIAYPLTLLSQRIQHILCDL